MVNADGTSVRSWHILLQCPLQAQGLSRKEVRIASSLLQLCSGQNWLTCLISVVWSLDIWVMVGLGVLAVWVSCPSGPAGCVRHAV